MIFAGTQSEDSFCCLVRTSHAQRFRRNFSQLSQFEFQTSTENPLAGIVDSERIALQFNLLKSLAIENLVKLVLSI